VPFMKSATGSFSMTSLILSASTVRSDSSLTSFLSS
jgi:hypothetical protein